MLTINDAAEMYFKAQTRMLSPETLLLYRHSLGYLVDHLGAGMMLEDITAGHIMAWRTALFDVTKYQNHPTISPKHDGLSVPSIRRIMGDVRTFFNWLVTIGLLEASPAANVKLPAEPQAGPRALDPGDFDKLLKAANDYRGNKWRLAAAYEARNTAVLYFLASTGCRIGGLCGARLQNLTINIDGGSCLVTEKGRGGGKDRVVYLSELAAVAILEWLDHRPETSHDYIFTGIEGESEGVPLRASAIRQMIGRIAERAGVNGNVNPHSFRHAAAREWLQNGADLSTVSQMLGHSEIGITNKFYARWTDNELQEVHKRVTWA